MMKPYPIVIPPRKNCPEFFSNDPLVFFQRIVEMQLESMKTALQVESAKEQRLANPRLIETLVDEVEGLAEILEYLVTDNLGEIRKIFESEVASLEKLQKGFRKKPFYNKPEATEIIILLSEGKKIFFKFCLDMLDVEERRRELEKKIKEALRY